VTKIDVSTSLCSAFEVQYTITYWPSPSVVPDTVVSESQ
jgi:hypothetical protein